MSKIIVDEERHETDGRDGGRWETVVGDRDILAQASVTTTICSHPLATL